MSRYSIPPFLLALAALGCSEDAPDTSQAQGGATAGADVSLGGNAAVGGAGAPASGGNTSVGGDTSVGGATGGVGGSSAGAGDLGGSGGNLDVGGGGSGGAQATSGSAAGGAAGGAGDPSTPPASDGELIGWATQGDGTKGGGDVPPIEVSSFVELQAAASGTDPKVIHVQGQLEGTLEVGSNKTIIGMSGASISGESGAMRITDSKNVMVKNLTIIGRPTGKNANTVLENAKNVWLDHIDFVDGQSDLLRIIGTTDFVTVSWCRFRHTVYGHEHMGVNIGFRDSDPSVGFLNVTLHHNVYADLVNERMPRARFGKIHIFNNLCQAKVGAATQTSYYAVRAGVDANIRSERNIYKDFTGESWFEGTASAAFNYDRSNENSVLQSIEDVFINCTESSTSAEGAPQGTFSKGTAFVPPYQYTADPTDDLEAALLAGVGPK